MHEITDAEKEFLDKAKELVRHYEISDGQLILSEDPEKLAIRRLTDFIAFGKVLTGQHATNKVHGAAQDIIKNKVLELLRSGYTSSKEITLVLGVSSQVVMGIKSHWTQGKYGDQVIQKPSVIPKVSWCYLILSSKGEVYLGATTDLRRRLRMHNAADNKSYTKGRRWHLLAALQFPTRKNAFDYEYKLKSSMALKKEWKIHSICRANKIASRYHYEFSPDVWNHQTF